MKTLKILIPAGALLFIVAAKVIDGPVHQRQHLLKGFVTEGAALGDAALLPVADHPGLPPLATA